MHGVQHKLLHSGAGLITIQIPSSAIDEIGRAGKSGKGLAHPITHARSGHGLELQLQLKTAA